MNCLLYRVRHNRRFTVRIVYNYVKLHCTFYTLYIILQSDITDITQTKFEFSIVVFVSCRRFPAYYFSLNSEYLVPLIFCSSLSWFSSAHTFFKILENKDYILNRVSLSKLLPSYNFGSTEMSSTVKCLEILVKNVLLCVDIGSWTI